MSALGDLYEAILSPPRRIERVHAERESHRVTAPAMEAERRWTERQPNVSGMTGETRERPAVETLRQRCWWDGERVRVERETRSGTVVTVAAGGEARTRDPRGTVHRASRDGSASVGDDLQRVLRPLWLPAVLELDPPRSIDWEERHAWETTGFERPEDLGPSGMFLLSELGPGADRYRIVVDAETGALLESEAWLDGERFLHSRFTLLDLDPDLDDGLFRLEPDPGADVVDVDQPRSRGVSLEAAAHIAPFPVLAPSRVPEGAEMVVALVSRRGTEDMVRIDYRVPARNGHHLTLIETPVGRPIEDGLDWEERQVEGHPVSIRRDPASHHPLQLKLTRDETFVRISTSLELDTALEVVASLRAVPADPVPLTDA